MIDFCSGLTYAVGGSMEKVAESVFLLTPSNVEVSPEERQRLSRERALPVLSTSAPTPDRGLDRGGR